MFNELDIVKLKRSIPDSKLEAGMVGTIVLVHQNPPGFEVEFCDSSGRTIDTIVLQDSDLEKFQE